MSSISTPRILWHSLIIILGGLSSFSNTLAQEPQPPLDIFTDESNIINSVFGNKGTMTLATTGAYEGSQHYVYSYSVSEWWDYLGLNFNNWGTAGTGIDVRGRESLQFACSASGPAAISVRLVGAAPSTFSSYVALTGLTSDYQLRTIPLALFTDMSLDDVASIAFNISGVQTGSGFLKLDSIRFIGDQEIIPDTEAPSVPAGLSATVTAFPVVQLSWNASTDNVIVEGYKVYRDSVAIATTANTDYVDTSVANGQQYGYAVSAFDDSGNESAASATIPVDIPENQSTSDNATLEEVLIQIKNRKDGVSTDDDVKSRIRSYFTSTAVGGLYEEESVPGNYHYKVDQLGYLPSEAKVAVISQAQRGQFSPDTFTPGPVIQVRTWPDNQVVFSGAPTAWNSGQEDPLCGDIGWWFDFSAVTTAGDYRLYDVDRQLYSHKFRIADDVYRSALIHAMRSYFYQREGIAKSEPYADARWTDAACFLQDANARYVIDPDNPALERDVSGGWMDAGDTNKYVTFADHTVHMLLHAYQANPDAWGDDHSIPESGNGIPDIIDEINYELEWVKKMQDSDGGVFIKAGDRTDVSSSPPSTHTTTRYYGRKASSSTIVLASIFAHAAYVYKDIPGLEDYANDLLVKAESAWLHYSNNPRTDSADNGEIRSGDADRTLVEQDRIAVSASMQGNRKL